MTRGLRLVVYDATGHGSARVQPLLTASWRVGGALHRRHPRFPVDDVFGARSWSEALAWLCSVRPGAPIAEVQFWGHGLPGRVFVGRDALDERSFVAAAAGDGRADRHEDLRALRARLDGPDALVWWRTCSAFGGRRGHAFAAAVADFFGCRAAGHTYVIGPWQSGLHSLAAGGRPTWDRHEGVSGDDEDAPSLTSTPLAPNTIHCLRGAIPVGW